ncbi:MAG: macro domain-containing protein [Lachnospiraceae bacterium]|nr:macro domain-containing protein [Lachnospiraceae bacterium]
MPFQIIRNDITKVKADAIVNTANPQPTYGGGTDSAIYKAAGEKELLAERKKIGVIKRGDIAVTPAFNLRAKYIIHTVAPAWEGGDKGEFETLKNCYSKSLERALELGCNSIAFPLIATGVYRFPKSDALRIAMDEISTFLMREDVDMNVKLVVFDDTAFRLSRNLFFQVESFINDEEVIKAHQKEYGIGTREFEHERDRYRREIRHLRDYAGGYEVYETGSYYEASDLASESVSIKKPLASEAIPIKQPSSSKPFNEHTFNKNLYMNDGKESFPFRNHLVDLLNKKNIDNIVAYKSSNIDRKAFAKILSGDTKNPQKRTVLAFCIGLKLTFEESQELLASADLAFNPYDKRDKLVRDCILSGQYNLVDINDMLFLCGQPQLGLFTKD